MSIFSIIEDNFNIIASSRQREVNKTDKEKRNDISYTASHAVVCLLSDFTPIFSHLSQKYVGDHGDHTHGSSNIWSHLEGEVLGDVVGVVATVALQRLSPEMMQSIRMAVEPIVRPFYEASAQKEADAWAIEHGKQQGGSEHLARISRQYEQEMNKLPMGIMWTVTSLLFNSSYQMSKAALSDRFQLNLPNLNEGSFMDITKGNIVGTLSTFALTNGLRVAFPRQTHKLDSFTYRYIAEPLSSFVGSVTRQGTVTQTEQQPSMPS
jgi:hypothetical protein